MTPPSSQDARRPRLAILSFSSGEYDARSFRLARSALAAGYEVTLYTRWHRGQPVMEELDGYRLVRADIDWKLAIPLLRRWAKPRSAARMAEAARHHGGHTADGGSQDPEADTALPAASAPGVAGRSWKAHPLMIPARLAVRAARRVFRRVRRWRAIVFIFPLRPMAWAIALDAVVAPADVWHGMWAGSLPALHRMSRRHGGRTIYDSRDVYMLSRDFARLEWPIRPILVAAERRWAKGVDRVLTVNEPYADLLVTQLGVARPPVVMNCPERWTPPMPPPDLIREATGIRADTFIALYQGQLTTERGIEQAMDAILAVPGAVLALLGFGSKTTQFRELSQTTRYAGRVFVLPAVPPAELLAWSASADVMVMPIQPTTTNHEFTTPQKLWEAIAAGVPVVAADMPGMATVVEAAEVGVLCDPTSPASIAEGIRRVIDRSPAQRAALREHVLRAAHETYNWENQLATLFGVYADLGYPPVSPLEEVLPGRPITTVPRGVEAPSPGPRLRFVPGPPPTGPIAADTTIVVLDTTWTPSPDGGAAPPVLLRDVVEAILRERDIFGDVAEALNDWAEASDIAGLLTHGGVSFWYGLRLANWMWLLDETLWLAVVERLVADRPETRVLAFDPGADGPLLAAARAIARRDALVVEWEGSRGGTAGLFARVTGQATTAVPVRDRAAPVVHAPRGPFARLRRRLTMRELERRRHAVLARVAVLERDPARRLLVVEAHARQRIDTASGPRLLNVYLGPVVDRLRGTHLEPIEVDIRAAMEDDDAWVRMSGPDAGRRLPSNVVPMLGSTVETAPLRAEVASVAARIGALRTPLVVSGVDLGPRLAARVAERVAATHSRRLVEAARIRVLLRRLHPAGILIADEYHRQDWLAAALAERVPVAAVQHGVIYRWHTGYMHRTRPPGLRLPDRTYVFGRWEQELLTGTGVYAPGEVVVGGSPRLDLVRPEPVDRAAVRDELGVAADDRLVVLSGTWGGLYRRFHYPIALAHLLARRVERMHLVVKLHPSEKDEGPYRRIVEGLAAAGGFPPPPVTLVRDVDLYRLLAAADAHLGIHSTVLTEAVATGTPNLIATGLVAADLLGYVDAGVAIPVATAEDLAAALDLPRDRAMDPDRRAAFLEAHFEPGNASARIADDLVRWLS